MAFLLKKGWRLTVHGSYYPVSCRQSVKRVYV